jgi:hypothetical protein
MDLAGGQGHGDSPAALGVDTPANLAALGPNGTLSGTNAGNVLVVGLRDAATDVYVAFYQKPGQADSWSNHNWDLSAFADGTTAYKIDLIDGRFGGWGHVEIDNVNIPGSLVPEPASLVLFSLGAFGLLAVARRRKA